MSTEVPTTPKWEHTQPDALGEKCRTSSLGKYKPDYTIDGNMVEITLTPEMGVVQAASGAMLFMSPHVKMGTSGGGMKKMIKRKMAGEGAMVGEYSYDGAHGPSATVAFAGSRPSTIVPIQLLNMGGQFTFRRGAFLCGVGELELSAKITAKVGVFGGGNMAMGSVKGDACVFFQAGGKSVVRDLAQDEELTLSDGALLGYSSGITTSVYKVSGLKNKFFGSEGSYLITCKGPGHLFIETLAPPRPVRE